MPPRSKLDIDFVDDGYQKHPNETDGLIVNALKEFEDEVGKIPVNEKKCLVEAQSKCPELLDDDFKLMFLRTDVFQADLAAKRYALYWENRVDLFGQEKAFLPMSIEGAMKEDLETHSYGYVRAIPSHERLLLLDPSRTAANYDIDSVTRSCVFTIQKALEASEEMQKKGAIFILDLGQVTVFSHRLVKRIADATNDGFPLRCSLCCIINPPPGVGFFLKVFKLFLKPQVRRRIHVIKSESKLKKLTGITTSDMVSLVNRQ